MCSLEVQAVCNSKHSEKMGSNDKHVLKSQIIRWWLARKSKQRKQNKTIRHVLKSMKIITARCICFGAAGCPGHEFNKGASGSWEEAMGWLSTNSAKMLTPFVGMFDCCDRLSCRYHRLGSSLLAVERSHHYL